MIGVQTQQRLAKNAIKYMAEPELKTAEQYESQRYQRTAEIESKAMHGLSYEERAEREADFMIRSSGLELKPGDRILDLASGVAQHAHVMRTKTGADIDAREISGTLVTEAKQREAIRQETGEVRGKLDVALGDMGRIREAIEDGAKYKLITIGGSSFMYLPTEEAHEKALADYFDLLEPGGKLVLQFRERVKPADESQRNEWCGKLGVNIGSKVAEGNTGNFGKYAKPGEQVPILADTNAGDGFYFYQIDNPTNPSEENTVSRHSFCRAYIQPDGTEEDMGPTHIIDLMSREGVAKGLNGMLERVGFKNTRLEEEELSPDGAWRMFSVVEEKPV